MTSFLPNIPQPNDNLDFSQGQLLANNQGLDTVFGIDHYKFSDATSNKGFHNKVTTPAFLDSPPSGNPPVTTTNPVFYAFQQTAPIGLIQFSRGPSNAVPTPLTRIHSTAAAITLTAGSSATVLDFAGLNQAYAKFYTYNAAVVSGIVSRTEWTVFWIGAPTSTFYLNLITGSDLNLIQSGSVLSVKNILSSTMSNVYWSLELIRVQ